jgi:hypothetical protein
MIAIVHSYLPFVSDCVVLDSHPQYQCKDSTKKCFCKEKVDKREVKERCEDIYNMCVMAVVVRLGWSIMGCLMVAGGGVVLFVVL